MRRKRRKRNRLSIEIVKAAIGATVVLLIFVALGVAISPTGQKWTQALLITGFGTDLTKPSVDSVILSANEEAPAFFPSKPPKETRVPTPEPLLVLRPSPAAELASASLPLTGFIVGIDPGHQKSADYDREPVRPGSDQLKARTSSGTYGRFTKVHEYEVDLQVGLKLRDMLEEAGATVIMTRETNEVRISNAERAELFNTYKVDIGLRIHCNGVDDPTVRGAFMLVPANEKYPYYQECIDAAELILESYVEATGFKNLKGIIYRNDMTGFNWCERPTCMIEMGHMTNKEDDLSMADDAFQYKMARGLFNGITRFLLGEKNGGF
ncbi:MAG: N-acetylmuramoyl-L-alanine amidase family protein [Christensenellales bacterium]|jgi:N-acetylmuramoyl-L-alanine amidase